MNALRTVCVSALTALAFLISPARAHATETLCDPSFQDRRQQLLNLIAAETTEIDVGLWFMEDARYSNAIVKRWQAGVQVRVLMDPRDFEQDSRGPSKS